ncbi:MAG: LysR family transcriptional regulator [Polyangiaceae bacterium]
MVHNSSAQPELPLGALVTFECVARHLRFARAADELRVTPTAVSKTIAQLEEQIGVRLLNRTTRSVALTEAGSRLLESAAPALATLRQGFEDARSTTEAPAGALRINTSYVAFTTLFAPHLPEFLAAYPRVVPEFSIESATEDIVARGFDAGVRPGRALQRDMVAVPLGPVQKLVVVGAPSYLERAKRPKKAADLLGHACIRQRLSAGQKFLSWTLRSGKRSLRWTCLRRSILDDMRSALDAARAGVGLAYVFEQFAAPWLRSGELERVLSSHALVREAFYLYFPSRRNLPPKLRVFADWFRAKNAP